MKLFYLTALNDQDREKCGILGKINGQINAYKKSDIEVYFGHFSGEKFSIEHEGKTILHNVKKGNTRTKLGSIYNYIYSLIRKKHIDIIYIRFASLDEKAINFFYNLHKINVQIIIEFYSHNLVLEAKKTALRDFKAGKVLNAIKSYASLTINQYYCTKLHNYVDLIVTTTPVDKLYGIPTINVVNGIDTSASSVRIKSNNEYDFNIVSVAMISTWHGYDRIIKGIANYYQNGGDKNIHYTVIGDGDEKANLEKLVHDLQLENHVEFTGIKVKEELEPYYNYADVALEMLAGFRRTDGNISSIKMAEYFAKGVPVLYASNSEIENFEIKKYCIYVENNDSDVDVFELIEKTNKIYSSSGNVSQKMHDVAKKYFDWTVTMKDLLSYINNKG